MTKISGNKKINNFLHYLITKNQFTKKFQEIHKIHDFWFDKLIFKMQFPQWNILQSGLETVLIFCHTFSKVTFSHQNSLKHKFYLTIQLGKALYFKKEWPLNKCPSSNNCKALTREYYRTKYIHMYNKSTTVQACSYTMRNVSETREKSSEPLTSLVIYTLIAKYVFIIWCKKYLKPLISTQVPLESYLLCHVHWRKVWKNEILHFC